MYQIYLPSDCFAKNVEYGRAESLFLHDIVVLSVTLGVVAVYHLKLFC